MKTFGHRGIHWLCLFDIRVELVNIHDSISTEYGTFKKSSTERSRELFLSKYRTEIMRVDLSVLTIPLFRVDVPLSSECIQFPTKFTQSEPDYKVELGKEFGPTDLTSSKDLGSREILKVLMVCNDVDGFHGAFKVMMPVFKGFKDS